MAERGWYDPVKPTDGKQYAGTFAVHGLEAVTASGAVASGPERQKDAEARHAATRAAQQQVWAYRRQVGELAHAGLFYENCFSRIRLTIAIEEDDGSRTPAFDEDGKARAAGADQALQILRDLRSPIGGQSQLMRQIGGCLGIVGEGHLVGTANEAMRSKEAWEFLSTSEFYQATTQMSTKAGAPVDYQRIVTPGAQPEIIKSDAAVVARIWQPDAEFSRLAWAPALGMLDIFDELVLLTREVAGAARSRLALAGILLVADDIEYPPDPNAPEGSEGKDPFTADLIKVASTAIRDKASAAGVVPLVVRVPANRVSEGAEEQGFRLIEFSRQWDDKAADKRGECVQRFAQGIDLPVEVVLGHMSTTFANAAQISADMYRTYVEPKVIIATDGLTTGYLRLKLPGTPFVIDPDPTDLVVRPDQIGDYADAHKNYVVSDAAWRQKLGATEADAPDDMEILRRVAIQQAVRERPIPEADTAVEAPIAGADPAIAASAIIDAATEVEVRRVLQRVGARLRSKVSNRDAAASTIRNVPDELVAATLGAATVSRLMTEQELLGREFDVLEMWATEIAGANAARDAGMRARAEAMRRLYAPAVR